MKVDAKDLIHCLKQLLHVNRSPQTHSYILLNMFTVLFCQLLKVILQFV